METAPLVATLTSVMAIGLTIVMMRLLRQDRQRSDARVAMLVSLAGRPAVDARPAIDAPLPRRAEPPVRLEPRTPAPPRRRGVVPTAPLPVAEVEIFRDYAFDSAATLTAAPELFDAAPVRTRNALVYVFAAAVIMAAAIALSFRWALSTAGTPTTETTAAVASAPAAAAQPLSLVSLRHEQAGDGTLVISGVVRNPAGSIPRERLFAAASLVDASGALIATARAPLDFTTLAPGDESPFVVRISNANGVARYRVGFRDASGQAVAHVDKR